MQNIHAKHIHTSISSRLRFFGECFFGECLSSTSRCMHVRKHVSSETKHTFKTYIGTIHDHTFKTYMQNIHPKHAYTPNVHVTCTRTTKRNRPIVPHIVLVARAGIATIRASFHDVITQSVTLVRQNEEFFK